MFSSSRSQSTKNDSKVDDPDFDTISNINLNLLMLRKPTELKKVLDSIPKPSNAVPKNGLPNWYHLGLESKLPIPKLPAGKVVFSRGRIGEDVKTLGLGPGPKPSFDLTDPYCYQMKYDYVPFHDRNLTAYFSQKASRDWMKQAGLITKDNRAVCSLKEFNDYRKFLYNRFQDRVHMEIKRLDELAHDTLILNRVEVDVARRQKIFFREERARAYRARMAIEQADEIEEKRQMARDKEKKAQQRLAYLEEFNEKQRKDRMAKIAEKENRIRQRVNAAAELELRRKITMIRTWRRNEKRRISRLKREKEEKERRKEQELNDNWAKRVALQNYNIQKQAALLRIYTHNMEALASRRAKRAQIHAYNYELQLQRLKAANLKLAHGGAAKRLQLVRKVGEEFEKCKRGTKGMSPEYAHKLAVDAMSNAFSTKGDNLMMIGAARAKMDIQTVMPTAPIHLLDEALETAIMVFTRRRVHLLLRNVESAVHSDMYMNKIQTSTKHEEKKKKKPAKAETRWAPPEKIQIHKLMPEYREPTRSIKFGPVEEHDPEFEPEKPMKSLRGRRPTPVPSLLELAQAAFSDPIKDLPDPVERSVDLPERTKLINTSEQTGKLLLKTVTGYVDKGLDISIQNVTLPQMKKRMEWGEAVEMLSEAVVNDRISHTSPELLRVSEFLAWRILRVLQMEMKEERYKAKNMALPKQPSKIMEIVRDLSQGKIQDKPNKKGKGSPKKGKKY